MPAVGEKKGVSRSADREDRPALTKATNREAMSAEATRLSTRLLRRLRAWGGSTLSEPTETEAARERASRLRERSERVAMDTEGVVVVVEVES